MLDGVSAALAHPGLIWVLVTVFVAGVVYGFAGFGSALIFMPVGVAVMTAAGAVAAFSLSALVSLVTVVPRAWRQADQRATLTSFGLLHVGRADWDRVTAEQA
jgi:uncharacterized membrane protein YfcA